MKMNRITFTKIEPKTGLASADSKVLSARKQKHFDYISEFYTGPTLSSEFDPFSCSMNSSVMN